MKRLMLFRNMKLTGKLVTAMILVGLVPLSIASIVNSRLASSALNDAAHNQLESLRVVKQAQIESYFEQIRKQVVTLSENRMIVDAMGEFRQAIKTLPQEVGATDVELAQYRREIANYYSGQFGKEYQAQNERSVNTASLLPSEATSIVAQYLYIANNRNPLGSKEVLDAANDGSRYSALHDKYHPIIRNYLQKFGFYDIFLIDPDSGQIVYSVFKEIDYATSLKTGPYRNTNFADAYAEALALGSTEESTLVDFKPYLPSYDGPASFIASPIFDGSRLIGVLMFQMPVGIINGIMQERSGLGETGETYLVGTDKFMRSQSRFTEENTILVSEVDSAATESIAIGETGGDTILDYRGISVLSSYSPLTIAGLDWGIIAEIDEDEALNAVGSLLNASLIVAAIALGLVLLSAVLFARSMIRPIAQSVKVAESIASGNLVTEVNAVTQCEIGDLLRALSTMQGKLIDVVRNIQGTSSSVKSGADEISQGNTDLSQRSEEQASSLEETASSMEEMTSTVKQNADNAGEANQLAMAAREEAEKGGAVVSQAVMAMNEINDSSKKISDIIGVIDEIAFQTNLLALNASVEAARAGDQGRGFAVVASEVRNLAGRSATAAKEIKELIVDSASKVDEGSRLVNESGATLEEIVNGVKKVTDIVGEIAAASKEQAAGIDEVNRAIVQMDDMTQQNAALVEQAAAASESLGEQADDLSQLINFFTLQGDTVATEATPMARATRAERRTVDRPWTAPKTAETSEAISAPAPSMKKAAAGDGDQEWEEF